MSLDKVPFFSNTSDDLRCYEASLRMILKYFKPQNEYTWEQMEQITGKKTGLWTWPQQGMVWLSNHGFEVINIEIFDYQRFIAKGGEYLIEFYGLEAGSAQINHSDIPREQITCKSFIECVKTEQRLPHWEDIKMLLDRGYLLNCMVNSAALNGKTGYIGHSIIITDIQGDTITIHDPGLPPIENRQIDKATFEHAWAYPDDGAKNLTAVKLIS